MVSFIFQAQHYSYEYSISIWEWILLLLVFVLLGIRVFNKNKKEKEHHIEDRQKETISNVISDDSVPSSKQSMIKRLKELQELKEAGVITDEEIEQEKRRLLNKTDGK